MSFGVCGHAVGSAVACVSAAPSIMSEVQELLLWGLRLEFNPDASCGHET